MSLPQQGSDGVSRMPGIVEVATPATPGSSLKTPSTPRIDISRASSSSQQEDSGSRESTPEKELLAGTYGLSLSLRFGFETDGRKKKKHLREQIFHLQEFNSFFFR